MSTSAAASTDDTQVLSSQATVMDATSQAGPADQDGGGHPLLDSDSGSTDSNNNEWRMTQRRKRLRTSTGSSSTAPSMSINDFEKLSMDGKMSALFGELSGLNNKVDKCVSVHSKVEVLEAQVGDHSTRITQLEYRSLDLEARSRRNNLIFSGIPESKNENCSETIAEFLKKNLNIDPCPAIPRVHRLGRYNRSKVRPIIAYFLDTRDSETVISKAKMLKGTNFSINKDYPKEISTARKALWPQLKELRRAYPDSKVSMAFPAKIKVDGEVVADKFPKWNLYLYGDKQSSDPNHMSTHRGKTQGARAQDAPRTTISANNQSDTQLPLNRREAASAMSSRSRRRSRSNSSRRHAPSRGRHSASRHSQRTSEDANIIRPWTTHSDNDDVASQSLLQGH